MGRQNQLVTQPRKQGESYLDAFAGAYTGSIPVSMLPSSSITEAGGILSPAPYDLSPRSLQNQHPNRDHQSPYAVIHTKSPACPLPSHFIHPAAHNYSLPALKSPMRLAILSFMPSSPSSIFATLSSINLPSWSIIPSSAS